MKGIKSVIGLLLILKFSEAAYNCSYQTGICSVDKQSISASEPFVVNRENASSVTLLVLSDGYMPQPPPTIFTKYPELNLLSIANMSLQEISSNVFTNAKKLISLLIMRGQLTTLNNGTFSGCENLQSLQVTNQKLSSIDIMAFQGLKNLQNLYLSNNQLTFIHPLVLATLPKLMNFNIDYNLLTEIDSQQFISNPVLYGVNFNSNQLKILPNNLFQAQKFLGSFYAADNQLITAQSFGASYVDVKNNKIRNFTLSSGESTVHIQNNLIRKIICSSTNLTVQRFYADNNFLTNFLCIRDMVNLTDLSVVNNKMPRPTKTPFLKLTKVRAFQMYNMTRFSTVLPKVFSPMVSLSNLRVDRLAAYKNLNITLPKVSILALTTTTWNCTYLSSVNSILKSQRIILVFNIGSDRSRCTL
ncbi:chondroadherin-like [Chironomus tepperi]|uniref:chondroadherin-like n=1 Tax=Chironomus tepperi TaxID=113505 RepID=UPI00391F7ADA